MNKNELFIEINQLSRTLRDSIKKIHEMATDAMTAKIDRTLSNFMNQKLLVTGKFDEVGKELKKSKPKK